MQLRQFQIQGSRSYSSRSGRGLVVLEVSRQSKQDDGGDGSDAQNGFDCGNLSIYENGEKMGEWEVKITRSGAVFCTSDDFYIALELFATMTASDL